MIDLSFPPLALALAWLTAATVGFGKTGVPATGILIVPLMTLVLPPKAALGTLLPMLLAADLFAVCYFRRHAQWRVLRIVLPSCVAGMGVAGVLVVWLSDIALKPLMGGLILVLLALQWARSRGIGGSVGTRGGAVILGALTGLATTIGNAGPIMSLFLLGRGLDKDAYMGTTAWFFLIVNALKVPLFVQVGLLTSETLTFDAMMAPGIVLGIVMGLLVLSRIRQRWFVRVSYGLAGVAAVPLLVGA
jgi:hypothetical protein